MTDADEHSVLLALGIDPDVDYAVPDHVWNTMIDAAVDPDTPASDASLVPVMDDHGSIPDTGDDAAITHHDVAHPDHHTVDAGGGDIDDHPDDHHHDPADDHQPDPGTHHTDHDHGSDPHHLDPGHLDPGSDWHI